MWTAPASRLLLFLVLLVALPHASTAQVNLTPVNATADGLNPQVAWVRPSFLTPPFLAKNRKPVMYFVHKSWCPACKNLKKGLLDPAISSEFVRLSKDFVMVSALDDEEPRELHMNPDGAYIPRILFLEPDGKVRPDLKCLKNQNPAYLYFYSTPEQVTDTMKKVRRIMRREIALRNPAPEPEEEDDIYEDDGPDEPAQGGGAGGPAQANTGGGDGKQAGSGGSPSNGEQGRKDGVGHPRRDEL